MAVFTTDYVRPLESVVTTFVREYGWPVTFEEAALVYSGDVIDVTQDYTVGVRALDPRGGRLRFTYKLSPDGTPPNDPAAVLRIALDAYHSAGFPGRYELSSVDGYFHIVPSARASAGGVLEPARSPLDALITIKGSGRPPEMVLKDLVRAVQQVSGYQVIIGRTPFLQGDQPTIVRQFEKESARAVLRYIIKATGRSRIWYLLYDIGTRRYYLSVV